MGNLTKFTEEITITPPLNWKEIQSTEAAMGREWEVTLSIDVKETETEDGTLALKSCSAVVPYRGVAYKGYYVKETLQRIIDHNPGHTFSGYFGCFSEEPDGPMWRLVVKDGKVHQVKPVISWPEPA